MDSLMRDSFQNILKSKGISMEPIYQAMSSDDLSDAVLAAKEVLDISGFFMHNRREGYSKSEVTSNTLREQGNMAYCAGQHQLALEYYNKALAYAPKNSRAMKLVYSNRSALLFKNLNVTASLNDINKCFALGCPEDIRGKLLKRQAEAQNMMWVENMASGVANTPFLKDFFKVKGKVNPDIPCASENVATIEECNIRKIVTTKDFKVGTVLALETAFTTLLNDANKYFACYYCTKLSLNLMPCSGCCHIFFCSEVCMKLSMEEGHGVECQFMDVIFDMDIPKVHYHFKSALKMRKLCKSWDEFIDASKCVGDDRIKNSTVEQIYNVNETFSLLSAKNDKVFVHGNLFYCSFACAVVMHYLRDVGNFLPEGEKDKLNAIRALMRITIHLYLHAPPMVVTPCASATKQVTQLHLTNYGSFSFMGKLKHSCHPNCLAVCLNKKMALIAIEPIKSGTELTVTQFGQFKSHEEVVAMNTQTFNRQLFRFYRKTCNCVCTDDKLTVAQRRMLTRLNFRLWDVDSPVDMPEVYPKLCKALAALSNVTHTEEYETMFDLFSGSILRAQELITCNAVLDFNHF